MFTDAKARKCKPGDKAISDGAVRGLYFFPGASLGKGKWVFRFKSPETGKRRDMGLGSYPVVSIKIAREEAFRARRLLESGKDPIEDRKRALEGEKRKLSLPTFAEAARQVHEDLKPGFRNKKHSDQWINTLEQYVFPSIGRVQVSNLTPADFAVALKPIWLEKPETASRVKQRCDAVMKWCAAHGYILASPVSVVSQILPKQPGKRERVANQPAVPWRDVPVFVRDVLRSGLQTPTKLMLEFLILTAARSGEVRQMEWTEIDFDNRVWTLPAQRMKAKVAHRVPLSPYLLELMEGVKEGADLEKTSLVFPSRKNTPVSDMTLTKCLRDNNVASDTPGRIATAHGFRSSFRDWASENGYPRDLAERALAHTIRNATEAAYHRTDLLEQRREMMLAWESWVLKEKG
ncbi:MAG: tyrosine-type recombinase/integrase [Roseibium sp.]|uniref:tyrosine-type recombinase/integrase n=1 Tax=Roseibium sp. TaxID=1936156 RepID=UPI00260AA134|nr:site-specific integrase [Roseibium sp.]MCV0426322.1 tyrosine-type recombinase/integrase [Roseibium sp.]